MLTYYSQNYAGITDRRRPKLYVVSYQPLIVLYAKLVAHFINTSLKCIAVEFNSLYSYKINDGRHRCIFRGGKEVLLPSKITLEAY